MKHMIRKNVFSGKLIAAICAMFFVMLAGISLAENSLKLPKAVTVIEEESFAGLAAENVLLSPGIERIEGRAFADSKLQKIQLPFSINYIAPDAFENCDDLVALVEKDSYAETWCKDKGIFYAFYEPLEDLLPAVQVKKPVKTKDGRILMSWNALEEARGYAVFESIGGIEVLSAVTEKTSAYISGITAGKHTYFVRAYDQQNRLFTSGEKSESLTVTIAENEFADSPVISYVTVPSSNHVRLTWSGTAANYVVLEQLNDGTEVQVAETKQREITLSDIEDGNHTYLVQAVYEDGRIGTSAQKSVSVSSEAGVVILNKDRVELLPNENIQLSATLLPVATTDTVRWKSSDTSIATVDTNTGKVYAISKGKAVITASAGSNTSIKASCEVEVFPLLNLSGGDFIVSKSVLTSYKGSGGVVVIPEGVRYINSDVFRGNTQITEVRFPSTFKTDITCFDYDSFSGCTSLKKIIIPEGVTSIGTKEATFKGCTALKNVVIPDSVTTLGSNLFRDCISLSSITLPKSITSIGAYAFYNCSALGSITIPDKIMNINERTFFGCSNLSSVFIPETVTSIGQYAFARCASLETINLPKNLKEIEPCLFMDCVKLKTIEIPSGINTIGYSAFSGCSSLESIDLPKGLRVIEGGLFANCSSLTHIDIPDNALAIGNSAFCGCSNLPNIVIPDHIKYIGQSAFEGCTSLSSVSTRESSSEGLLDPNVFSLSAFDKGYILREKAFAGCSSLISITIPGGIDILDNNIFSGCTSLTSVTIGEGVRTIGDDTFNRLTTLERVTIPGSVTSIGARAFLGCTGIHSLSIPGSVATIGLSAFQSCLSLTSITIEDGVAEIGMYAFKDCQALTTVSLPNSLKCVDWELFTDCISLKSIVIPAGASSIGLKAFCNCQSLSRILIPESVEGISSDAFHRYYYVTDSLNLDVTIYGSAGSYAQQFADDNGIAFKNAGEWPETVSKPGKKAGSAPEEIMIKPETIVLHPGESGSLSIVTLPVDAIIRPCSVVSMNDSVVQWDSKKEKLIATGIGTTTLKATSYNGKTCTGQVLVLPEGYEQEDWNAILNRIDNQYEWMVFFNKFLNGGGVNPKGNDINGIDLSRLTKNYITTAYANVFGYSSLKIEGVVSKAITIFSNLMDELSSRKDVSFAEASKTVKDTLSYLDLGLDSYNAVYELYESLWYAGKFYGDAFDLKMLKSVIKDNDVELKALSLAGDAAESVMLIINVCNSHLKYSTVNRSEAEVYAHALAKSSDKALQLASVMIYDYVRLSSIEKLETLCGYIGLVPAAKKAAAKLIGKGIEYGVTELASALEIGGPIAMGASLGIAFGTTVNNLIMNVDAIQEAAFKAQYAIGLASSYLSLFQSAYAGFKQQPFSEEKFNDLAASYLAYKSLLGDAFEALADLPKAFDEALASELGSLLTGKNYENLVESAKDYAKIVRTYMDYDLGTYGEAFFPNSSVWKYLNH